MNTEYNWVEACKKCAITPLFPTFVASLGCPSYLCVAVLVKGMMLKRIAEILV